MAVEVRRARLGKVLGKMVVVLVAVLGSGLLAAMAQAAAPPTTATIVDPGNGVAENSGGSQTTFTVQLPPQASCSGDTATMGYHVYSYMVLDSQISSDPATLTFDATNGPSHGLPLFDLNASPYNSANTAPNTGQVIQIPNFNYAALAATDAPPGLYDVGIACSKPTTGGPLAVDRFWNVQVNFSASASDPNGFNWLVAGATAPTTTTPTTVAGATTTTPTTVAGATTTTPTTAAGSTTTTASTVAGPTTTSTSSTVPGTTSTSATTVADPTTTSSSVAVSGSSGSLASTGRTLSDLLRWAVLLILAGAWALRAAQRRGRTPGL